MDVFQVLKAAVKEFGAITKSGVTDKDLARGK